MDVFLGWLITELQKLFLSGYWSLSMPQKAHIYWQILLLLLTFPAQLTHSIKTSWKTEFQICWRCSIKLHFWELDSKKLFQEMISYTLAAALLQGKDEVVQIQSSIQTFFIAFLHIYNKTWSYSMRNLRVLNLSLESCNYTDVH